MNIEFTSGRGDEGSLAATPPVRTDPRDGEPADPGMFAAGECTAASTSSASIVVFTTVNGTLRQGESGSYEDARAALALLASRGIPVVVMSHDEANCVQALQHDLGLKQPFICNGGEVLHIPRGYFAELDGLTAGDESWERFEFGVRDPAGAVRLLASLYSVRGEEILTVGFGSEWVDRDLLSAVDVPVVVRSDDAAQNMLLRRLPGAYLTAAMGPAGWSEAILGPAAT